MRSTRWAVALLVVAASVAYGNEGVSAEVMALLQKAQNGDVEAQFRLASAYDTGQGAPRSGAEAMKWYRAAAERGHAEAQNSVGSGLQAEEKYPEALLWYERAASQGHPLATNNLAYLHDLGLGVKQDRQKAFELYSRAASLGWAESMWNIANMYGAGQVGEKKDLFMACVWTLRARSHSEPSSEVHRQATRVHSYLERTLGERFVECQKTSGAWAPSPGTPP